ncbi:hypothetical protein [Novipirellula artificiosorum]|uniref:Uncharacterized protein n=1 Tax=Novipirellula artificiosorum TaxID=2528016 RepID=A0A5C6E5H8_9BACT|nr:hypothetical protein [Novipirellula artificiosorum]TWU42686.1 hypothetical protein Poly41_09860 [Novipirellula artificiosorum]
MLSEFAILADRNSAANQWLRENPLVLSAGMTVLGCALLYFGVAGLKSGTARDKYGNELTGGLAKLSSLVRFIGGIGLIGTAIYIAIFGAW